MKVFLSGYGKMGRMLEELALEHGWEVVGHADITCPEAYETAPGADVCLDFSGVGALQPLLGYLHRTKTALVSGTTGLTEPDLDALQELGRELPVIWTANYSTGIAVFRRMLHDYAGVLAGWDKEIVVSLRGGTVAGEHTVYFFGEDETLQITHRAASRRIFAAGALRAAQAICGRGPGFYTLDELLFEI